MDVVKIAKKLAETFDCPCNFSPLDEEMQAYCMEHYIDDATKEVLKKSFSYLSDYPVRDVDYVVEQCKKIVDQLEELEK